MSQTIKIYSIIALTVLFLACGITLSILSKSFRSNRKDERISPSTLEENRVDADKIAYLRKIQNYAPNLPVNKSLCVEPAMWGKPHAGGWMVCKDSITKPAFGCVVYSFGLGADWSFDIAADEFGCQVHGFDPTGELWREGMHGEAYSRIDYKAQYPSRNKFFHNWGLGAADIATYPIGSIPQEWPGLGDPQLSKSNPSPWEMRSISRTLHDLQHHKSGITILKVDVEGAEWDAFYAFVSTMADKNSDIKPGVVKQLLVEWHWDPDSTLRNNRHYKLLRTLEEIGYKPWNIEKHSGENDCCLDVSYIWSPNE